MHLLIDATLETNSRTDALEMIWVSIAKTTYIAKKAEEKNKSEDLTEMEIATTKGTIQIQFIP